MFRCDTERLNEEVDIKIVEMSSLDVYVLVFLRYPGTVLVFHTAKLSDPSLSEVFAVFWLVLWI